MALAVVVAALVGLVGCGNEGLISVVADTGFVFVVTATDSNRNSLTGRIEISTG